MIFTIMDIHGISEVFKCMICLHRPRAAHICPHCSKMCCYNCATKWLGSGNSCPHCRKFVSLDQLVNCRWADDVSEKLLELEKSMESNEDIERSQFAAGLDTSGGASSALNESFDGSGTSSGKAIGADTCPVTGKALSVYCDDFDAFICHHCALWNKKYAGCTFRDLDDVYSANVESILSRLKELRARQRELLIHAQHVEKNADDIRASYQVIENVTLERVNKLHDDVRGYLDQQLQNKLSHVMGTKNILTQKTRELEHMLLKVEDELQSSSRCQLVRNSKHLLDRFSQILDVDSLVSRGIQSPSCATDTAETHVRVAPSPNTGLDVVSPVFHAPIAPRYLCGKLQLFLNKYRKLTRDQQQQDSSITVELNANARDTSSINGPVNVVTIDAQTATGTAGFYNEGHSSVGFTYSGNTDGVVVSDTVVQYGYKWRLKVYPAGTQSGLHTHLSVFLEMISCPLGARWSLGVPRHEWKVELVKPRTNQTSSIQRHDDSSVVSRDSGAVNAPQDSLSFVTSSSLRFTSLVSQDGSPSLSRQEDTEPVSERLSEREYACQFSPGECWGYERFYSLEHLFNDGFVDATDNTITLSFGVRSTTLFQYSVPCIYMISMVFLIC